MALDGLKAKRWFEKNRSSGSERLGRDSIVSIFMSSLFCLSLNILCVVVWHLEDERFLRRLPGYDKSPKLNTHCERVMQTIKHEALDYFVVFGEDHLNYIVSEL